MNTFFITLLATIALGVYPTPKNVESHEGAVPNLGKDMRILYCEDPKLGSEEYRLEFAPQSCGELLPPVTLSYSTPAGRFYGEQTFAQVCANPEFAKAIPACVITDRPALARRGVVEGYYGRPWGKRGRLSLLKFMGQHKLNLLIYGPKDDPYHHKEWRKLYPDAEKREFVEVLDCAKSNFVNFTWAIHLGGTFAKSGSEREQDFARMFAKLEDMYAIGFRSFAVFFDDSGDSNAEGHSEICNRIVKEFIERKGDVAPLIMCPERYIGLGDNDYIATIKAKLDPKVDVMWTGIRVCSDIPEKDVQAITAAQGRKPFLWWNWPVNDYCRRAIGLGRTYGLECADLAGFVTNPMENCEANKIGIFGCADWAWNPEGFNSQKNWEDSFARLYPDPEIAKAMKTLADHNSAVGNRTWCFDREESVKVDSSTDKAALFNEIRAAMLVLELKLPQADPELWFEIAGWVRCERALVEQGLEALKGESLNRAEIARARREFKAAQEDHVARFKKATFTGDVRRVRACEPSTKVLAPMVEKMLLSVLVPSWEQAHGEKFTGLRKIKVLSTAKSLEQPPVSRIGENAGFDTIYEPITLAPGEYIGFGLPEDWATTRCRLRFAEKEVKGIALELSKDGEEWSSPCRKLPSAWETSERLVSDGKDSGYRYMRLRNVGAEPATFTLWSCTFVVSGDYSPIDELLK